MAPAAADTIYQHLKDTGRTPKDYDQIITGDLGSVGQTILKDLLMDRGIDLKDRHDDCGILIYNSQTQDTHAGGSGCGCAAATLAPISCLRCFVVSGTGFFWFLPEHLCPR